MSKKNTNKEVIAEFLCGLQYAKEVAQGANEGMLSCGVERKLKNDTLKKIAKKIYAHVVSQLVGLNKNEKEVSFETLSLDCEIRNTERAEENYYCDSYEIFVSLCDAVENCAEQKFVEIFNECCENDKHL